MRGLRLSSKLLSLSVVMLVPALLGLLPLAADLSGGTASVLLWCTGLFLVAAVYLLLGFYQGLSQDVNQVRLAMDKMVQGDLHLAVGCGVYKNLVVS
ncbi:MAG: hypothetical protein CFE43_02285 [Burkholderiales bacterium PBB3]|nr:MAG: hypothetical protein CFE43_02285 [Burkholderiales bacterium PBB3]